MKSGDTQASPFNGDGQGVADALAYAGVGGLVTTGPLGAISVSNDWSIPQGCELRVGPGTYTFESTANIILGAFATLRGCGYGITSFKIGTTFSSTELIVPSATDGTQQSCMLYSFEINGNKAAGGTVTQAIYLKGIGQPSIVRDVVVFSCSGTGIRLEGVSSDAASLPALENVWVNACDDHNIRVTGPFGAVTMNRISTETVAANKAGIYIDGTSGATTEAGIWLQDIHIEALPANAIGIPLEDCKNVSVDKVLYYGSGGTGDLIKITGTTTDSYNHTLRDIYSKFSALANTVNDVTNGVTLANEVPFYSDAPHRFQGNVTAIGTVDVTGNLTARGAANNIGTAGTAQTTTIGQGGSGSAQSDLVINSGSSGSTKARVLFERNGQADLLFQGDGTTEQTQFRHAHQWSTTAGAQIAYMTTGSKMRLGSTGTPTYGFEVGTAGLLVDSDEAKPFTIKKATVGVSAPGAGYGMLRWEAGTGANTAKLVAYAGTSTTGTTIVDNVGGGF